MRRTFRNLPVQPFRSSCRRGVRRGWRPSARSADIWNVSGRYSPQSYATEAAEFDRACDDVGRDPQTVGRSLGLVALVGEDESDVSRRLVDWEQQAPWLFESASPEELRSYGLVGTPQEVCERIEEFRQPGGDRARLEFLAAAVRLEFLSRVGYRRGGGPACVQGGVPVGYGQRRHPCLDDLAAANSSSSW